MPTVLTRHDSYERDLTPAAGIVCGTTRADEAPVKPRWSFNQRRSRGDGSTGYYDTLPLVFARSRTSPSSPGATLKLEIWSLSLDRLMMDQGWNWKDRRIPFP